MEQQETEIKLPVRNPRVLKRQLRELGFRRLRPRYFESNHLFDFPDQRLRKAHSLIRLRFEGRKGVLTYKGTPQKSDGYKVRREIETFVDDGPSAKEILGGLGLQETFVYQKYRTVYAPPGKQRFAKSACVDYDETPIGDFLELEGPKPWIDGVAAQLGYSREDYVTESYATLYFRKCAEQNRRPGKMVFPHNKS